MLEAYRATRKDGATGIDGATAADYAEQLEANLLDLLDRIKSGRYQAPPVRRSYIPKADGSQRPLGIPTFEDKVAQRAIVMLLEAIYEQDFLPCSYGFRPGRSAHDALHDLRTALMTQGMRWVLDIDIKRYFDTIPHAQLRRFLDQRVTDGVVRRMIDKWLKAGVLEDGSLSYSTEGTPQGGVISPLLANIYLHYVLDEWVATVVSQRLKGRYILVRYADDLVMAFEDHLDAKRVFRVLDQRLNRFGLTLHPEKSRFIDFRFRRPGGQHHPATSGTTFDFLGFTHVWGRSLKGKNVVRQVTAKGRFARALSAVTEWCQTQSAPTDPPTACSPLRDAAWPLWLLWHHRQRTSDPVVSPSGRAGLEEVAIAQRATRKLPMGPPARSAEPASFAACTDHSPDTPSRAKLSHEEPDAGNLHVRVCEGWGRQRPHLLGTGPGSPGPAFAPRSTGR